MKREDVELAADDYAYKKWAGGGFECASSDSFIAGADWRINSVWHDASERPNLRKPLIIESKAGVFFHEKGYSGPWRYNCEQFGFIRWAYVDDLQPERKE